MGRAPESTGGAPLPAPSTAPRAAIRLRRARSTPGSLCEPTPNTTHARRGPPSPKPSSSPRGESLDTSVIKRTRHVNTRSGTSHSEPVWWRCVRKHVPAHGSATAGRPSYAVRSRAGVCGAHMSDRVRLTARREEGRPSCGDDRYVVTDRAVRHTPHRGTPTSPNYPWRQAITGTARSGRGGTSYHRAAERPPARRVTGRSGPRPDIPGPPGARA